MSRPPWVTDSGLAHLSGLSALQILEISSTEVKGPGLRHLATDAGLEQLAKLPKLSVRRQMVLVTAHGPRPSALRLDGRIFLVLPPSLKVRFRHRRGIING
jgi:hypothetical protein